MQEINAVQEYEYVDLHNTFYKKGPLSQIVTDEEVMNVIGQFKRVSVFFYHPCVICWTKLNLMCM